jgi:hypothetical protein
MSPMRYELVVISQQTTFFIVSQQYADELALSHALNDQCIYIYCFRLFITCSQFILPVRRVTGSSVSQRANQPKHCSVKLRFTSRIEANRVDSNLIRYDALHTAPFGLQRTLYSTFALREWRRDSLRAATSVITSTGSIRDP